MPWVRLDDSFPEHAKVSRAGDAAAWMYVAGLCYCSRANTDGFISESRMRKLTDSRSPAKLASILLREGLWEAADGGYRVHDYHDYQPTAAEVSARRKATAARVRSHRNRKRTQDVTRYNPVTNSRISARAGVPASGRVGELTDKNQGEEEIDVRARIDEALSILGAISSWDMDDPNVQVGVENAWASYPNVDLLQGCRLAVTWASDPSWEMGCAATLRSALKRLDLESKPKPKTVQQTVNEKRTAALRELAAEGGIAL